jgi:hypothetical protein
MSEVAMEHGLLKEIPVLDDDRTIEPHLLLEDLDILHLGFRGEEEEGRIGVQEEEKERDHRNDQTDADRLNQALDDIGLHDVSSVVKRGRYVTREP